MGPMPSDEQPAMNPYGGGGWNPDWQQIRKEGSGTPVSLITLKSFQTAIEHTLSHPSQAPELRQTMVLGVLSHQLSDPR